MASDAIFADFCAPLIGLPVSHVWRGYGSAIFLEFGKLRPTTRLDGKIGDPNGEWGLMIEWSWRIEGPRAILCGSWSEAPLLAKTFTKLRRAKVANVAPFGRLHEIEVTLSNGLRVISFSTVEGQPQWALFHRDAGSWLTVRRGALRVERAKRASP